jgi:hypothetical protein
MPCIPHLHNDMLLERKTSVIATDGNDHFYEFPMLWAFSEVAGNPSRCHASVPVIIQYNPHKWNRPDDCSPIALTFFTDDVDKLRQGLFAYFATGGRYQHQLTTKHARARPA